MDFAVQVKNLVKVYDGKVKALDGVELDVEPGEVFALLGPNGAGKTTLIRILTTQLKPTAGEAYIFGLNVVRNGGKVRRLISYVPQEMSVWTDISGYENLLVYAKIFDVPSHERGKIIDEVLENMGLTHVKNDLVRTYSGGMIRRLEIACAMLTKPKIMFLDEPTIGLDPAARKVVWERLGVFKEEYGVTIFFTTHYMDEADLYADDIAIINQGKIVARGTSEDLKHSLGGEVISFTLEKAAIKPELFQELRKLVFVKDVLVENGSLNVFVDDAESTLSILMNFLKSEGLSVGKVSINKPTLDDVFLKHVGTRLEEKGRISDVTQMRYMIRRG
ncbi:MAG: ABC transporter [Candidatus Terraquivivens tikiterensis]|uniref:ABC transporter n=1 Tax=Candidatus Terraquivivens tikiterensis TaxID=1980982 RepID=A0A2R7Y9D8_9ARCH|nr:MAG: ABC transporter [Candidatus Terraquivivens tikiterensis]